MNLLALTQDEVLKSIRQHLSQDVQPQAILWLFGAFTVLLVGLIYLGKSRQRREKAPPPNDARKLNKQIARELKIKNSEARKLKTLAETLRTRHKIPVANPLVLLLCPSLLGKAMKK